MYSIKHNNVCCVRLNTYIFCYCILVIVVVYPIIYIYS